MSDTYFAISYSPALRTILRLFGLGPTRSGVWVGQESVRVTMGWGFRATIPREAVSETNRDTGVVTGWGVHGWRGQWLVNGSSSGLVRLAIVPGTQAWVMGVPVRLQTLRLSLTAPDEFISLLSNAR